jgi:hypothetical protein
MSSRRRADFSDHLQVHSETGGVWRKIARALAREKNIPFVFRAAIQKLYANSNALPRGDPEALC